MSTCKEVKVVSIVKIKIVSNESKAFLEKNLDEIILRTEMWLNSLPVAFVGRETNGGTKVHCRFDIKRQLFQNEDEDKLCQSINPGQVDIEQL